MRKTTPTVVDLFAGAGLFSYAFRAEGFKIAAAIEREKTASATYQANLGDCIETADIRQCTPAGRCTVLIAGPPCQGYSTLGKRDPADPRNVLSLEVLRWAKALRPEVVVIENVPAFLESETWLKVARSLRASGYTVRTLPLNALDFGVPQHRVRSFTIAVRGELPDIRIPKRREFATVRQAFRGLPPNPNGRNHHHAPTPSQIALARFRVIPPGGDKRDVMRNAPHLAPPSWWKVHCEVTDVWGRMQWDQPSNTLRTCLLNASKGRYIHPECDRVITLREAARLQTVPDSWRFAGTPYQIARQIGNSVPPALGRAIARFTRTLIG